MWAFDNLGYCLLGNMSNVRIAVSHGGISFSCSEHGIQSYYASNVACQSKVNAMCFCARLQVLLRARPTVSQSDLKSYEQFTSEFGEDG